MATIGFFLLDDAKSHVNATLGIAKALRRHGHHVSYLAPLDVEEHIRAQEFEFRAFCPTLIPKGFQQKMMSDSAVWKGLWTQLGELLIKGELDEVVRGSGFDLLVVDSYVQDLALIAYKVGVPTILLSPTLPRARHSWVPPRTQALVPDSFQAKLKIRLWWYRHDLRRAKRVLAGFIRGYKRSRIERLAEAVDYPRKHLDTSGLFPILTLIPELVLCPQSFDLPRHRDKYHHIQYIGAYVDLERNDRGEFPWHRLREEKNLIYCALGTVSHKFGGAMEFYRKVLAVMAARPDWQLVMAVGNHVRVDDFDAVPENVVIVNSAPQLELLGRASLMINHGGLNSVKESIMYGVPMIVFPWHGVPVNAVRVVYHGLGLMGDIRTVDATQLQSMIDTIDRDPSFRARTEAMRKRFIEIEEAETGVRAIEQFLERARSLGQASDE